MRVRKVFLVLALVLAPLAPFLAAPVSANPAHPLSYRQSHPLVIIIPGDQVAVSGVSSTEEADGETMAMRGTKAAAKIRDFLNDSHTIDATLYAPDSPLFVRAAQEAKLNLGQRYTLSADEQVSLAKASGAVYIAVVGIHRAIDGGGNYEVSLDGIEPTSRKVYSDRAKYQLQKPGVVVGDANAVRVEAALTPANALNSAANTLVTRLLNGPLAAYGRVAPAPILTPAKTEVPPDPTATSEADIITASLQQANSLITDGNSGGAIISLRRAINQAPLNLKLRMMLARAYLSGHHGSEAASEIKRAFVLTNPSETERKEAISLLAESFQQSGNGSAARSAYEDIIASQPQATWARLALAELLTPTQPAGAEAQYRAILKAEPDNKEAIKGIVHLIASRGDFDAALAAVVPVGEDVASKQARVTTAAMLFDEFATQAAKSLQQNRAAWTSKQMTRETFYKATVSQVAQATALVNLLKSAPPVEGDTSGKEVYAHRVLAGSLLAQSAAALQNFLETGDKEAGGQSALWITECQKELALCAK